MSRKWFLDTSYAIALAASRDELHEKALALASEIEQHQIGIVTTRAVVLEIGNALSKRRFRIDTIAMLSALEADSNVEIVPLSEELYGRAFELYSQRADKQWGLTDCISFVVMRGLGLDKALTADDHFRQAGFLPLLLAG